MRFDSPGATAVISENAAAVSWSQRQACGPPDTPTAGDHVTAWASSTTDGQIEWLELDFASAVRPASVKVVETYNPGALFRVDLYRSDGSMATAWEGADPTPVGAGMGTSEVPLTVDFEPVDFPTRTIRIWLDSPKVPSWNEIDAVGLVDAFGNVQWAVKARASSVYGQSGVQPATSGPPSPPTGPSPADLLPSFGDLRQSSEIIAAGGAYLERRVVAGFGWPMRSLWAPLPESLNSTATAAIPFTSLTAATMIMPAPAPLMPAPARPAAYRAALPWRPAWPGLAVNTLLYAVAVYCVYWVAVKPRRFVVEVSRIRRGACRECGYDLGYDFIPGCPECGWRRANQAR